MPEHNWPILNLTPRSQIQILLKLIFLSEKQALDAELLKATSQLSCLENSLILCFDNIENIATVSQGAL